MKTELILLAAGQSKRFGGIKQLTDIHGQAMICHCLSQYRQGTNWLDGIHSGFIALGANADLITEVLPKTIKQHVIQSWQQGMGHTLAQSMKFIAKDTSHVFIGLADQVLISQAIIERMLGQIEQYPQHIIAANYANKLGAPAIFPQPYFSQLAQLSGDRGAQGLLMKNLDNVISMPIPQADLDIDTRQDLKFI